MAVESTACVGVYRGCIAVKLGLGEAEAGISRSGLVVSDEWENFGGE